MVANYLTLLQQVLHILQPLEPDSCEPHPASLDSELWGFGFLAGELLQSAMVMRCVSQEIVVATELGTAVLLIATVRVLEAFEVLAIEYPVVTLWVLLAYLLGDSLNTL